MNRWLELSVLLPDFLGGRRAGGQITHGQYNEAFTKTQTEGVMRTSRSGNKKASMCNHYSELHKNDCSPRNNLLRETADLKQNQ